jgi:2-C-methyl-D-erythritol 4-phosphate cytidylyltransferase/2-C-methyl-D-erythritol 2,4-cyclodiphosphate synthase
MTNLRIGHGYDVHRLVPERALILGGVNIPYEKGLLGHSDAGVLLHAVMDAVLGALGAGDIGRHFPDSDEAYRGADSLYLASHVAELLKQNDYIIVNVDATLIAQRPKIAPWIEEMRQNLARALSIDIGQINVKATTEEHLGFTGEGLGMAAHAVCLIEAL